MCEDMVLLSYLGQVFISTQQTGPGKAQEWAWALGVEVNPTRGPHCLVLSNPISRKRAENVLGSHIYSWDSPTRSNLGYLAPLRKRV